ncbi:hypothetical protein GCM10009840_04150 [Pseudolysinimonas kribbensis]|uniref:Smf/DprA SLOG domain-containing protein n=1 Tax=Pseudolysinimonas kribbensis TaxID=433641 RepID=A0ABQ6K635_9MICO|nr:DNA-processing protein DprA [Pseudolysinimonas kribbensis]GMA94744.1 hypothetical protein GCM10025881_15680 [Pseudolysinimonas kribbensis]
MPTTDTRLPSPEVCARVALATAGLGGNRHIGAAIRDRGSAVDLVAAAYDNDPFLELPADISTRLRALGGGHTVAAVLEITIQRGYRILTPGHDEWPAQVEVLGTAAPVALWASGSGAALHDLPVVVTGSTCPDPWLRHDVIDLTTRIAGDGWTVATAARPGVDNLAHQSTLAMDAPLVTVATTAREGHARGEVVISENPPLLPVVLASALRTPVILAALAGKVLVAGGEAGSGAMRTGIAAHALARPLGVVGGSEGRAGGNRLQEQFGAPLIQTLAEVERLV